MVKYYVQAVQPNELQQYLDGLEGIDREFVQVSVPSPALVVVTKDSSIPSINEPIEPPESRKGFLSFLRRKTR
tara:strand:+ start:187 stop:405 length:219 start_codon:yes stop_codon:yes gene_type:complete